MRSVVLFAAAVTLVPLLDAPASRSAESPRVPHASVSQAGVATVPLRSIEDRVRSFAENALGLEGDEVEEFVDAARTIADLLGVDLSQESGGYGGGFVLILVLFILLVIIGAGFGLGYGRT